MISAITWIPKGVSKSEPFVAADPPPSNNDIQGFLTLHSSESENENEDDEEDVNITLALKDLHMEHYDDDDEDQGIYLSFFSVCFSSSCIHSFIHFMNNN